MNATTQTRADGVVGNGTLATPLTTTEREAMKDAAARKLEELFDILQIDHRACHNMRGTADRFAKMLVDETMGGRYAPPPRITDFDNVRALSDLIVTGPIDLRSTCAHHLMPIVGHVVVGVVPNADGRIIGLSKYDRIVEYFGSRPQIQEELGDQIAKFVTDSTGAAGVAVRVSAEHMCKTHRGVRASRDSRMVTVAMDGTFLADAELRARFQNECLHLESSRRG